MPGIRAPLEVRFFNKVKKTETCWIWIGAKDPKGYGRIGTGGRKGKDVFAHRLSFKLHKGEIPEGMYICHRCDNPACVKPDHLFMGTQVDNMRDCVRKGRLNPFKPKGEKNPKAKLTWEQVRNMRKNFIAYPGSYKDLSMSYGVRICTISNIIRKKTWIES